MPAQSFTSEQRRQFLGASDVGAILGLNKYQTPYELLQLKRGEVEPTPPNNHMQWGSLLEDFIAEMIQLDLPTGLKLRKYTKAFVHPQIPYFQCHLDRIVANDATIAYEIKKTTKQAYESYKDGLGGVPSYIYAQVQAQFACRPSLRQIIVVAALLDQSQLEYHTLTPDFDFIHEMEQTVRHFWEKCVHGDELPQKMGLADYQLIESTDGETVEADSSDLAILRELSSIQQDLSELDLRKKRLLDNLSNKMNSAEKMLNGSGKTLVSFKTNVSQRFDSKKFKEAQPDVYASYVSESTSRVMRPNYKALENEVLDVNALGGATLPSFMTN